MKKVILSIIVLSLFGLILTGCSQQSSDSSESSSEGYPYYINVDSVTLSSNMIGVNEPVTITIRANATESGGSAYYEFKASGGTFDKDAITNTTEAIVRFSSTEMGTHTISYEVFGYDPETGRLGFSSEGERKIIVMPWTIEELPFAVVSDSSAKFSVDGVGENDFWIGKYDFIAHYDGTNWNKIECPLAEKRIRDIEFMDSDDVRTVSGTGYWDSKCLKYNGVTWEVEFEANRGEIYYGFEIVQAYNIPYTWIVTSLGRVLHYNGTSWTSYEASSDALYSVSSPLMLTDIWSVGENGKILHSSGGGFTEVTSPTTSDLNYIKMYFPNDGWAVGNDGVILRYNGSSWQSMASPTTNDLYQLDFVSPDNGWVVGEDILLKYDGSEWKLIGDFSCLGDFRYKLQAIKMFGEDKGVILVERYNRDTRSEDKWYMFSCNP